MKSKSSNLRTILCLELLKTFSKKELEGLSHFIDCQHFNKDKCVIKLYEFLRNHNLNNITFSDDFQCKVYNDIFSYLPKSGSSLTKNQYSLLNSKLNILKSLAEKFLSIEALEKNDAYRNELLYPILLERKQFLSFNRHIKKEKKLLDGQVIKGKAYYAQRYKMEHNIIDYLQSNNKFIEESNISEVIYNLDMHYLLNKLEVHLVMLSTLQSQTQKEYNFLPIDAISPLLQLPEYAKHPLIVLYQTNIELEKTRKSETYFHLLDLLEKYEGELSEIMLRNFYTNATNYCAFQIRVGKSEYNKNIFDLYRIMHNKNLLVDNNGFTSIQILKNMILMSCRMGEFEWAKGLIKHYEKYIPKSVRADVCQYNYGMIAFYKKDYETAHDRFIQVDKINTSYDTSNRIQIIKCLYEKEEKYSESMMTAFRSAEKYFKENKSLPSQKKKEYINFIQILINLYRIRHHEGKRTIKWLKEKLEQQQVNSDKQWLLEKVAELEKNRG